MAAAFDWAIVLIAYALFVLVFRKCGWHITLNKINGIIFGAVLPLLGFAYGLIWALAGIETFGMQCLKLRLITFDGFPPDKRQRLMRFMGSCLSLLTMLGLLWSAVDEESIAWQDHISRTFPTPSDR
jgi:uncharacterized RDD family membrane protein YckC